MSETGTNSLVMWDRGGRVALISIMPFIQRLSSEANELHHKDLPVLNRPHHVV